LHGTDITLVGQESSFYAITKFSIERSDAVTAVSSYLRDETYRAFGCVSCDLKVIPNFVNLNEYQPGEPTARLGLAPDGHKLITHVSNFREVKRVKDVVRVFTRIQRAMPATLVMIGDGPERVDAENEARELGVGQEVKFLGRLDSVASLLQASDQLDYFRERKNWIHGRDTHLQSPHVGRPHGKHSQRRICVQ